MDRAKALIDLTKVMTDRLCTIDIQRGSISRNELFCSNLIAIETATAEIKVVPSDSWPSLRILSKK